MISIIIKLNAKLNNTTHYSAQMIKIILLYFTIRWALYPLLNINVSLIINSAAQCHGYVSFYKTTILANSDFCFFYLIGTKNIKMLHYIFFIITI